MTSPTEIVLSQAPKAGSEPTTPTRSPEVRATVSLRGGGLRELVVDGLDLVEPYPSRAVAPGCAGAVLFPWPNRIRDGRWSQRGVVYQLPVNEPELNTAVHGLVVDAPFAVTAQTSQSVTVATRVTPRPGYPFAVELSVSYRVVARGIEVGYQVVNWSGWPAPFCLGAHPYLRLGTEPTDNLTLRIGADAYLRVDEQLIPVGEAPVAGSLDLRSGRRLSGLTLNHCLTRIELVRGWHRYWLDRADGLRVELWADPAFGYAQVYTCQDFPRVGWDGVPVVGRAIAVEPMTAPANSFNSGTGLRWLADREVWSASWGINLHTPT